MHVPASQYSVCDRYMGNCPSEQAPDTSKRCPVPTGVGGVPLTQDEIERRIGEFNRGFDEYFKSKNMPQQNMQ